MSEDSSVDDFSAELESTDSDDTARAVSTSQRGIYGINVDLRLMETMRYDR